MAAGEEERRGGSAGVAERPRKGLVLRQRLMLLLSAAFLVFLVDWWWRDRLDFSGLDTVRVLVVVIVPPGQGATPWLTDFARAGEGPVPGLKAIRDVYGREYSRYHPDAQPQIDVDVSGPHEHRVEPPDVDEPGLPAWRALLRGLRYYWYFRALGRTLGVDFDQYDIRLVLLFEDESDGAQTEAESRASRNQRFGVVRLPLDEGDRLYAMVTILHEMGHTLGATDKYDDTFLAAWPEGYAEPRRRPVHPQRQAEIMAVDVPVGPDVEREVTDLSELRVGALTAFEVGWIPRERMEHAYAGLPRRPDPGRGVPGPRAAAAPAGRRDPGEGGAR